ncbi:putative monooxygenase [Acephala macrosclerotiorum]|nr:putative monooxygenase [Acephala macrosclerotiorum]
MTTKPSHFLSGKQIIVAGGGIAGSTFVAALGQLWDPSLKRPKITVLERTARETSIEQDPYMLSLSGGNVDEGLVALQQLGLLDDIRVHATLNSGAIWVWADNWKLLASINPEPYGDLPATTMRITRSDLKRILLEKAEKAEKCTWQWECTCEKAEKCTWQWECTCEKAERLPNSQVRVTISNNADAPSSSRTLTQDCDLLIAADGADSQIYTPFDDMTVGWALSKMGPERATKTSFTAEEFATLKKEALKLGSAGKFEEPFKTIAEATDSTTAFIRPAKEKASFHYDTPLRGVVFIGDMNYVLNSFTLDGVNLALKDGWDLAEQLCRHGSIEEAVKAYDKKAVARAEHVIKWSHEGIRFGHSTGLMWKVYKYGMEAQKKMGKK